MTITSNRATIFSPSTPSTPRLRMEPTGSRRGPLDGAWWPRSTDPVAELPGLVLAIDHLRGPVRQLILNAQGWDSHPRRLGVAGRVIRPGYFASQPATLLTAICDGGGRVDLLVIPPDTPRRIAETAMFIAAAADNVLPAQDILLAASTADPSATDRLPEDVWETDGSRSHLVAATPDRAAGRAHVVLEHAQTRRSSNVSN
jgi:hypothetical protein